ncbi:hypothetical protein [Ohtaekwangia sp.]|uniref:hypothetical protein n=1 Tax=Ohtaekwangia sp. TaxID=2066019 RepID=UPI002FDF016D
MRRFFFITLLSCQIFQGVAQTILKPQFKDKENLSFRDYLYRELVKHKALLTTRCERVTGSIQIMLDKDGNVRSISVTGEMTDTLRQTLKEIAYSSRKLWTPMEIEGRKIDSYPIVLLMSLHLGEGCSSSREMILKAIKSDFSKALISESGNEDTGLCFLLPPLIVIWDYIPTDIGFEKK